MSDQNLTGEATHKPRRPEPDMQLPDGKTCLDCAHFRWCDKFLGGNISSNAQCDWAPSRFIEIGERRG